MNTRTLGYLIIFLIFLAIGTIAVFAIRLVSTPLNTRVMVFNHVGNINKEDPVSINGIKVGSIQNLEGVKDKIYATVVFTESVKIYSNYQIATLDKGLMGDRLIILFPGTDAFPEMSEKDTLNGIFIAGVSEILGMVWEFEKTIGEIVQATSAFISGSDNNPPFTEKFSSILKQIDSISAQIAIISAVTDKDFYKALDKISHIAASAEKITMKIDSSASPMLDSIDIKVRKFDLLISELETTLEQVNIFTSKAEKALSGSGQKTLSDLNSKISGIKELSDKIREGETRIKLHISRLKE